jgi:DNA modification methylase
MDYDMVFTSPPYYNKEIYGSKDAPYKTNDEWDEQFYKPIFRATWDNLKKGGHYCLNIPQCIYEKICVPLLGEANELIELKKYARILPKRDTKQFNVGQKYKEFIYIWKKA